MKTLTLPVGMHLDLAGLPEPGLGSERADDLGGRDAAGLDVGREADAHQPALRAGRGLVGPELLVVEHRQQLVEGAAVVAAVVGERHLRLVAVVELGDEVLPADLDRVHLERGRRRVHHALEQVAGLGAPRPAVGVHRGGVGEDPGDLRVDRGPLVHPVEQGGVEIGRHRRREGGEVGAQVRGGLHPQPQELAVLRDRDLGVGHVIPPVGVGLEGLAARRRPADRPLDLLGGPGADRLLVVEEDLGAEGAAHVGRDDPHLVLRDAEHEGGHQEPVHVGVLRGHPERPVSRWSRRSAPRRRAAPSDWPPGAG